MAGDHSLSEFRSWLFRTLYCDIPEGTTLTGTSQGNAHPENGSTVHFFASSGVSSEVSASDPALPQPFTDGEWEAIVAAAVASVAEIEAAEAQAHGQLDPAEAAITDLLEAQPTGSRAFSLPIAAGASTRVLTWHSRAYWLSLCEWVTTHTDRGQAALKRHGIAAETFVRGCVAHAQFAESTTGRRVSACLGTLVSRSGLSIDQLKRTRRVLKTLELGVEQARGKKLNQVEREAAARHYEQIHGQAPVRPQSGAASVWTLSAPQWAVEAMPTPERKVKAKRRPRRRLARATRSTTTAPRSGSSASGSSTGSAPQSPSGFLGSSCSVRNNSLTRAEARTGEEISTTTTSMRPLALQRAAAELVERIPALRGLVGIDDLTGRRRGHIGTVCDLLVEAGIDTDRWTGVDIAQALTLDGIARGWTWPTADAMTAPLRLVAWRLRQVDWSGISPTEHKVAGRQLDAEAPASASYRLVKARRMVLAATQSVQAPPASAEHRQALRARFAAEQAARKAAAATV
uniref:Putative Rep protein n=1 Tax=Rhodococcus hoagii TaxID=43767 RepID=A0A0F6WFN4_RHOHA|nr:putative Rep protein [Prescottella equi]